MSIIPQEATEKEVLFGRIQKFFSKHKIGALLKKCNGAKEKGVSAVSSNIFKYKYTNANNYLLQAKYLVKTTTVSNDSLIYKGELEGIKIYQESSHDYMYLMYRKKGGTQYFTVFKYQE